MGSLIKGLTKYLNPLAMPVARAGIVPIWGVVRHTGRKSGHPFATPIALMRTRDGFVIPLPWGEKTDWCRNIVAAHGGVVRFKGRDFEVRDPEVIDRTTAAPAFFAPIRALLPVIGIEKFLRVRSVDAVHRAA